MKEKKIAFYHCHTPLHIGSGTTLDVIDLPIQREAHTDFPVMPSTAIKGVIRAEYWNEKISKVKNKNKEKCLIKEAKRLVNIPESPDKCDNFFEEVCKYKSENKDIIDNGCKEFLKKEMEEFCKNEFFNIFGYGDREGDIIFTDGKILLFPVKSVKGVFAWITCPLVLERFIRDTDISEENNTLNDLKNILKNFNIEDNQAIAGDDIVITSEKNNKENKNRKRYLVLEEISFIVKNNENGIKNNENGILEKIVKILPEGLEVSKEKIAIVSNNRFRYFVKNHTEVNARIRIDQTTGTVDKNTGGLWYEELVPAETVFYNLILSRTNSKDNNNLNLISNFIDGEIFQFGGDETLGRGFTKVYVKEG